VATATHGECKRVRLVSSSEARVDTLVPNLNDRLHEQIEVLAAETRNGAT